MNELNLKWGPPPKTCFYCGDTLQWTVKDGYVHSDGKTYVTFVGEDGEERDDHCVQAVEPGHEQHPLTGRKPE